MPSSLFLEWLCQDVYVIETSITEQAMMKPMAVGREDDSVCEVLAEQA